MTIDIDSSDRRSDNTEKLLKSESYLTDEKHTPARYTPLSTVSEEIKILQDRRNYVGFRHDAG